MHWILNKLKIMLNNYIKLMFPIDYNVINLHFHDDN